MPNTCAGRARRKIRVTAARLEFGANAAGLSRQLPLPAKRRSASQSYRYAMKQIKIDLAGPFEEIIAKLRSIPPVNNLNLSKDPAAFEPAEEPFSRN